MPNSITKAFEMTNAKISFVSLVDKAANRKQFLITKAEKGNASFRTYGRILKADVQSHLVTGIVYEPMAEDTDGNYMTEEEITKAAHWFAKNGQGVDLQHNFESLEGAFVVESSVAKCDMDIDGQQIKKGTWLMTVEITDDAIYDAIEKGQLTGFSMGGVGIYSDEDVDISKADPSADVEKTEKRGIIKALARLLGIDDSEPVQKGAVKEDYMKRVKSDNFWTAFYALQDALLKYDYESDRRVFTGDRDTITEALKDFNEIITTLLTDDEALWKAVKEDPIEKAGKTLSTKNLETLKSIHESLGKFLDSNNSEKEETEVTKEQAQEIAVEAAMAAIEKACGTSGSGTADDKKKKKGCVTKEYTDEEIGELINAAVEKAVEKAMGELGGEEPSADPEPEEEPDIEDVVEKAVAKAMAPFMAQAGLPTNLDNTNVQKSEEQHYLHGFI